MTAARDTSPRPQEPPARRPEAAVREAPETGAAAWSRPGYRIVETSLEVTAYGLTKR